MLWINLINTKRENLAVVQSDIVLNMEGSVEQLPDT